MRSTDLRRRRLGAALAAGLLLGLAALPAAAAERLVIGARFGTIDFAVGNSKVFRTSGTFGDWQGTVKVDDGDLGQSSVDVVVNTRSIQMLDEQQTELLKEGDFFDVERFPQLTFKSRRVERVGEHELRVEGDVTMRGVTRPMTLAVSVTDRQPGAAPGARYARFRGFGTLKRSEFGMTKFVDMVGDTVEFSIATEARRP